MKKIITAVVICAMLVTMFIPATVSAKDGDLLIDVDFRNDTFKTVHALTEETFGFEKKFDLSTVTSDTLLFQKNAEADDAAWKEPMFYMEETGYYLTETSKYTMYFEIATPHNTKYSGVPLIHEVDGDYDYYIMMWGAFSDNGDNKDSDGKQWSEFRIVYNYGEDKYRLGTGYNSKNLTFYHPALATETIPTDNCTSTPISEVKFATMKVEFEGLIAHFFYLDETGNFVRLETDGEPIEYISVVGAEVLLGTYARDAERHNIIRNMKLLQGTGLTLTDIMTAPQTTDPKPPKPEATTTASTTTEAPATATAVPDTTTEAPAATTAAPADSSVPANTTAAPAETTAAAGGGCGSFMVFLPVTLVTTAAAVFVTRKKRF